HALGVRGLRAAQNRNSKFETRNKLEVRNPKFEILSSIFYLLSSQSLSLRPRSNEQTDARNPSHRPPPARLLAPPPLPALNPQPSTSSQHSITPILRLLAEKLPFILLSFASCAITVFAQSRGGAVKDALPLFVRMENAAIAYARYLGLAIWPAKLSIVYPHPG